MVEWWLVLVPANNGRSIYSWVGYVPLLLVVRCEQGLSQLSQVAEQIAK